MSKEKIYQVEVPVKSIEMCLVKARSKAEAIRIFKEGDFDENPSVYSSENIFNSNEIKTHRLGSSDFGDYLWGSAKATEVEQ